MNYLFFLFAILAGVFTTIEASINAQLGKYITPGVATLHSLIVGVVFMLVLTLMDGSITHYTKVVTVKPLWLIGGVFGALIIYLSSISIPEIGISNTLILILTGQLVSGLIIDAVISNVEIGMKKMVGMVLFLVGTILFLRE
jgi:bacterial/archaeal transporter family-2 protein